LEKREFFQIGLLLRGRERRREGVNVYTYCWW
jgi:hypothetical protein